MKSSLLIAAAAAGLAAAQNLTGEPECAIPCLSSAIAAVCTPVSDTACACASQGAIGQAGLSCLLSNCDGPGLTQAQAAGAQICSDFSATATGSPSTTASGTNTSAPTTTPFSSAGTNRTTATSSTSSSHTTGSVASVTPTRATTTGSSATATSSAGAGSANVVAVQAGLLGALLAGVAAVL